MIIKVDDINTDELQIYKELRENAFRSDRSFIADSPKVVNLLLESDLEIKSILATQEYYDEFMPLVQSKNIPKVYLTTKEEMSRIVGHKIHHNCMAHGIRPDDIALEGAGECIIMLDNITSSENVGSIARSAAALGVTSYFLPKSSPHPFNRRALRVSMGYAHRLGIYIYKDIFETIAALKSAGYRVYAAEVTEDSTPLSSLHVSAKWVLLMGHEGKGIAQDILDLCDEIVSIEMQEGIKSFNVGVAASILMYNFLKQQ
ncbi:RNA methyltransferase [Sulfurimonas sediminis]|uniref:RNA methyltransferase n=1 Tax=Sulfurimonas sediminis TaxID=2590020 RepID=A0A7M1B4J6_9BACT|nr:RNA methyltransferase [Sulfurimonas sediminis]QOP44590.1 RNA methyltransferase [Sulfurimonas sediminis]